MEGSDIESDKCKIKISAVENEKIYDISEQVFTISKLSKLKRFLIQQIIKNIMRKKI